MLEPLLLAELGESSEILAKRMTDLQGEAKIKAALKGGWHEFKILVKDARLRVTTSKTPKLKI